MLALTFFCRPGHHNAGSNIVKSASLNFLCRPGHHTVTIIVIIIVIIIIILLLLLLIIIPVTINYGFKFTDLCEFGGGLNLMENKCLWRVH